MTGHGTEQKALIAHDKYGLNKFDVPVPPFGELLKEHLMWVDGMGDFAQPVYWDHLQVLPST